MFTAELISRILEQITNKSLFPSIFCTFVVFSLYGEYVVHSFLPGVVFLPCDHGLDF